MEKVAKFEYVSNKQYLEDAGCNLPQVALPKRATSGSAGYDIIAPFDIVLKPGETIKVPTGLRCKISDGWVMFILPKSGLGFKYRTQLDNTVGVIDADYYNADNEGHIMIKLTNDTHEGKTLEVSAGKAFCQAIFLPFGITVDDRAEGERKGGFGSTNA